MPDVQSRLGFRIQRVWGSGPQIQSLTAQAFLDPGLEYACQLF